MSIQLVPFLILTILTLLAPHISLAQGPAPEDFVNALEDREGIHKGFRRAHAKGVCGTGYFLGNGKASDLSKALLLEDGRKTPVTFRFSLGGGLPLAPDTRRAPRSMALILHQDDGHQWRTAMNHVPVFVIKDPADFPRLHRAHVPDPSTGKPDPAKVKAFFDKHPEAQNFNKALKDGPLPASFLTSPYYSANAFILENAGGAKQPVRWSFYPEAGVTSITDEDLKKQDPNFMFQNLKERIDQGNAKWQLEFQLAAGSDNLADPTTPWPDDRPRVNAGTLVLEEISDRSPYCDSQNFDPSILPPGITASSDPLIFARSAAYNVSQERRLTEQFMDKMEKK